MTGKISERTEEYLEALYHLQEEGKEISISTLKEELGVSAPSVFEMFQRLIKEGYLISLDRGRYALTEKGLSLGEAVVRRHRLLERLLVDVLDMSWDSAHEEACRLEHGMSQEMEDSLVRKLGNPSTCPHGNPIVGKNAPVLPALTMNDLHTGEKGKVLAIRDEETDLLHFLSSLGLLPGVPFEVKGSFPRLGQMISFLKGKEFFLPKDISGKIVVERI